MCLPFLTPTLNIATVLRLDATQIAAHALYRKCGYSPVGYAILGGIECIQYENLL
jgi:hypothetical protein